MHRRRFTSLEQRPGDARRSEVGPTRRSRQAAVSRGNWMKYTRLGCDCRNARDPVRLVGRDHRESAQRDRCRLKTLLTNCTVSRPMRSAGQAACSSGNACASRTASCTASERYCGVDADRSRRWASADGSRRENTCGSGGRILSLCRGATRLIRYRGRGGLRAARRNSGNARTGWN